MNRRYKYAKSHDGFRLIQLQYYNQAIEYNEDLTEKQLDLHNMQ